MDGWNTTFLLGRPIFRGYVSYVSFREGKVHLQYCSREMSWGVFRHKRHFMPWEISSPRISLKWHGATPRVWNCQKDGGHLTGPLFWEGTRIRRLFLIYEFNLKTKTTSLKAKNLIFGKEITHWVVFTNQDYNARSLPSGKTRYHDFCVAIWLFVLCCQMYVFS